MAYLKEFQSLINSRNYPKFLQLWEEYSHSDQVDVEEFSKILQAIKDSEFSKPFGAIIETVLPLWQTIPGKDDSYHILKLIFDIQNTNSPALADLALEVLKGRYSQEPQFNERLRLVGLRSRDNFQGALTNYDLLSHMENGNFVFHPGGWGTGEIVEVSQLRQQIAVEFENVAGRKQLTFENAFKCLIPLKESHFLVRRFAFPDDLEKEAKENPVQVIKTLLTDLGPKTAQEIKDELVELVIPEKEWSKWWSSTRAKLKKDPFIDSPENLKEPFNLRKSEVSQEDLLQKSLKKGNSTTEIIDVAYEFLRDLSDTPKNQAVRDSLKEKLIEQLKNPAITLDQELQICICLENYFSFLTEGKEPKTLIQKWNNIDEVINSIEIIALKKRALGLVKEYRKDWDKVFLNLMYSTKHSILREFIVKELDSGNKALLEDALQQLLRHPEKQPEFFVWYFQKILNEKENIPFANQEGICRFFDSFLVLLSILENKSEYKDLVKKMYTIISNKRYEVIRQIFEKSSIEYVKEFLLLASKCQSFTDHDKKILRSLAAVVFPSLSQGDQFGEDKNSHILWTTEEGYLKLQDKIRHLGTVEIVENAREVEAARALGDLRENSEYKFAVEKRSRLQGQLRTLSEEFKRARIITKEDVHPEEVGIGSIVLLEDVKGNKTKYTILGPWDANPDMNILSFQSKFAQSMLGCKKGETFLFREEKYKVASVQSFLDKD